MLDYSGNLERNERLSEAKVLDMRRSSILGCLVELTDVSVKKWKI